jgi:hypothetical protein
MNQQTAWLVGANPANDEREHEDLEGEFDTLEASDLEIQGESDCNGMGNSTIDDEPSTIHDRHRQSN